MKKIFTTYYVNVFFTFGFMVSLFSCTKTVKPEKTSEEQSNIPVAEKKETYPPDMQKAMDYAEQSEYLFRYQQTPTAFQNPNSAHNKRFRYKDDGLEAKASVDSTAQGNVAIQLHGISRGKRQVLAVPLLVL